MSQSYPWIKLDHVSYRHGEFRAKASMQARYAYHELITIAPMQTPSFSIPNDDAVIAGWLNISVKQWLKVRDLVLSQFTQGDDGRFYCNMLVEIYSETNNETNAPTQPKRQRSNSAERVARYRAKSKPSNADVTPPVTHDVTPSNANVTPKNVTCNANVTPVTVTSVTNGGIKGGDLDLDLNKDLDLDQKLNSHSNAREAEKKPSRFFDDELRPDVNALNAKLGANLITQKFIDENLFSFNAYYETRQLTDNQRLAKWINWFKGEEAKKQAQTIQRPKQATSKTWQSKEDERKAFNKAAMDEFVNGCSGSNIIDGEARHVI